MQSDQSPLNELEFASAVESFLLKVLAQSDSKKYPILVDEAKSWCQTQKFESERAEEHINHALNRLMLTREITYFGYPELTNGDSPIRIGTSFRITDKGIERLEQEWLNSLVNELPKKQSFRREHSLDFRSVRWDGRSYSFTPLQAACVAILWQAYSQGTPDVADATILTKVDAAGSQRLADIFKRQPAWNSMIVPGETRGTHRLQAPADH